jgi:hypothetical protein
MALRIDGSDPSGDLGNLLETKADTTALATKADKTPVQNPQTGTTYSFVSADVGKLVTAGSASASVYTLPAQATVTWAADTQLSFMVIGAGTVTLSWPAGVTVNGLASGDTSLTLATSKGGSLVRTAINTWTFIPFSGGVEAANFTNTETGTYTDAGVDYKYITFTGSGSLVVDRAGLVDVLVVGGGGSTGSGGGGGAGAALQFLNTYVPVGTITVTIGAGASGASGRRAGPGTRSAFANCVGAGGGSADTHFGSSFDGQVLGISGGCGSGFSIGSSGGTNYGGSSVVGLFGGGYMGYTNIGQGGGGSGGNSNGFSSAFGPYLSNNNAVAGGIGMVSSITGTSTYYAGGGAGHYPGATKSGGLGGGGNSQTNGVANTGGGAGGSWASGGNSGGSGIVIIRVRTN